MRTTAVLGTTLAALATAAVVSAPGAGAWAPDDARAAACDFIRQVSNYDHANLDGYVQRVLDRSTGKFAADFAGSAAAVTDAMRSVQSRAWVESAECGSVGGDLLRQTVLINLVQVRSNATDPEPKRQVIVIRATVENVWGRWLVSDIDSPQV